MAEPEYEVVWPLGRSAYEIVPLAHRSPDLHRETIGELWDWAFRGDEMFPVIRELLKKKYPGVKMVESTAFGSTFDRKQREMLARLPDLLKKHGCTSVISGVGA